MLRHPPCRFVTCLLAASLLGCSTAKTVDVLESRLRHQEDMLASYESEMNRVKSELTATRREAEDLRLQLAESGQTVIPAEESGALFRAAGIQFSALMSGGTDVDGETGHDGLSVVLVPHDHAGELVKLPGNIEIEAFDLSLPGGAQRIGQWRFDQRDVDRYWHKGVIQSGYQFELPWQTPPTSEKLLLVGHLSAANGRQFDTTLTVSIDPPTSDARSSSAMARSRAGADDDNPFAVRQAAAAASDSEIIWADGEGPAANRQRTRDRSSEDPRGHPASAVGTSPFFRDNHSRLAPARAQSLTGAQFSENLDRTPSLRGQASSQSLRQRPAHAPLSRQPSSPASPPTSPRSAPSGFGFPIGSPPWEQASPERLRDSARQAAREVPPSIEDWWADDDWPAETARPDQDAIRTSDAFTDETIPRYR